MVKDPTEITDVDEMKTLILELQKELDDLEKSNEELLDEVEVKGAAYMDEVEELEFTIAEMKQQEVDFKSQMKEQCEEYRELLSQKMARDMEIAAYRSLVEEEEVRLCIL
ncbi:peripherin [Poecilia reticulata]|uniref:peripherin n=1 Tax=Poecilia reticulata TaxID=8081 RepID=UPI0007EB2434|nr:PREDICTED: peripherin-like [Poecilia reticulata]